MSTVDHWQKIYSARPSEKLGWYNPHMKISLRWIEKMDLAADAPIIDVGGGTSTLVDDLIEAGHRSNTVLDISKHALSSARARLGEKQKLVTWIDADIMVAELPQCRYELWHDRAMFHFLVSPEQSEKYVGNLFRALKPGGHVIMGTFAPEAPSTGSGLPVRRYSLEELQNTIGNDFELVRHDKEIHITPGGTEQMYLFCHFRKKTDQWLHGRQSASRCKEAFSAS